MTNMESRQSYLEFSRMPDPEVLQVSVSTSDHFGSIRVYWSGDELTELANGLVTWPPPEKLRAEIGKEDPRWAHYLLIESIQIARSGLFAVHVRMNSNRPIPNNELLDISITANGSDVAELGRGLKQLIANKSETYKWKSQI